MKFTTVLFFLFSMQLVYGQSELNRIELYDEDNIISTAHFEYNAFGLVFFQVENNLSSFQCDIFYGASGLIDSMSYVKNYLGIHKKQLAFSYSDNQLDTIHHYGENESGYYSFLYNDDQLENLQFYLSNLSGSYIRWKRTYEYNDNSYIKKTRKTDYWSNDPQDSEYDEHTYSYENEILTSLHRSEAGGHGYSTCYYTFDADTLTNLRSRYYNGGDEVVSDVERIPSYANFMMNDVQNPKKILSLLNMLDLHELIGASMNITHFGNHRTIDSINITQLIDTDKKHTIYFYYDSPTSVDKYHLPIDFSIYPNPASRFIHIESDYDIRKIEILSKTGNTLISKSSETTINLSDLANGIYIIRVFTDLGQTQKFVVVQR